ncbi:hypothetical protein RHGRI_028754 [Rhododendron griersonianum]|uniref:Uncharacterized protein n=1 Tax=Rhododendron griersonianum TaxID=479676 RepID=A0AAV6IHQ5_9ERIC|nr:hypothetical protein RHGRI_028754 [Rhododendron griersonianum]
MNCSESASKRSSGDRFGIGYNAELGAPRLLRPRPEGVPCHHRKGLYLILIIIQLWRTFLLTPFKLITVFLHEASHAIACILTCGTVEGMEVHANEGGVTQTRGGAYWVILPAGYLGSSFWGMIFILASTNLLTTRIAAGCFAVALLIVLFVAKNSAKSKYSYVYNFNYLTSFIPLLKTVDPSRTLRWFYCPLRCSLGSPRIHKSSHPSICHSLHWYVIALLKSDLANFAGVMNSLFSVYDIYDDLISRRVNSSDAEKFAEVCPCPCNGAAWGDLSLSHFLVQPFILDLSYCLELIDRFSDLDGILLDIVETGEHSFIPIISSIALRVSFSSYSFRFLIHLRPQVSIYCET